MKQISNKVKIAIVLSLIVFFSSCIHKDFEEPPVTTIPTGRIFTIQDLYTLYDSVLMEGETSFKFTEDCSVYAVISMDDKSGNIYKSAYMQDGTKGINLHLMSSGGLYEGDSVRVFLKGLTLSDYSGMMQLDSVYVDDNVVKVATQKDVVPELISIDQIFTGQFLAKIVKIENIQFSDDDLGLTYANSIDLITENREIEDETGQSIIVRTSGYASFAGNNIPEGRGSIIALVGRFNDDWQLYIRSTSEVVFDQRRFGDVDTIMHTGFDGIDNGTSVNLTDWMNIAETGVLSWVGSNNGESATVKIVGDGNEDANWLILPEMTIAGAKMMFQSRAGQYTGAELKVYASTDYNGGANPEDFTWTELPSVIASATASSFGDWTNSGEVDLSAYDGQVYIAFKYESTAGQSCQYYLDDILIYSE